MWDPGITSEAFLDTLLIRPSKSPLCSQLLDLVKALIDFFQTSGLRDKTLILNLGFKCPIVATEACARFPPPAIVT